jgi:HAD superfamily hydrolase (TIGR01490 family)
MDKKQLNLISFFDVDHTITKRSTAGVYGLLAVKKGVFPVSCLFSVPKHFLSYRYSGMNNKDYLVKDVPFISGLKKEILDELADENFKKVKKYIYADAEKHIKSNQDAGSLVVLATSSVDIIIRPLAEYFGIKDVIATKIETENGLCTGRFSGTPVFRDEKAKRVSSFAAEKNTPLSSCCFYSDSIHDLPLLSMVGSPVTVNPDYMLKRKAKKAGWPVLHFT